MITETELEKAFREELEPKLTALDIRRKKIAHKLYVAYFFFALAMFSGLMISLNRNAENQAA